MFIRSDTRTKKSTHKVTPVFNHSISAHRNKLRLEKSQLRPANVFNQDILVAAGNHDIYRPVRVYRPRNIRESPYPTIFYVPGNAFVAGETDFTDAICFHLAEQSTCQVIMVTHCLAPENPFPAGLEDVLAVFNTIMRSSLLEIDKEKIAIAGYSSGGNFAASLAGYAKAQGLPVARQILISPLLDLSRSPTKYKIFEDKDTVIQEAFVRWFLDFYLPPNINRQNSRVSPLWYADEECQGLPPADIFCGEYDRFRGDAELYHEKLKNAGVSSELFIAENMDHSLMWYSHALLRLIGARIRTAFHLDTVPRPFPGSSKYPSPAFFSQKPIADILEVKTENLPQIKY